jgi:uncharacterized protein with HEPN domain
MRREELYLQDIVEAADYIARFVAESGLSGFRESEMVRSAIVQKLGVIGEAASRVSDELKDHHAEVLWPKVVAFRNILIHAYFGIDWDIVWLAASEETPVLRDQIARILDEFGKPDSAA